jgi:hypothetical protein
MDHNVSTGAGHKIFPSDVRSQATPGLRPAQVSLSFEISRRKADACAAGTTRYGTQEKNAARALASTPGVIDRQQVPGFTNISGNTNTRIDFISLPAIFKPLNGGEPECSQGSICRITRVYRPA